MFGGVEAGGTKFVCVIGTGPGEIVETLRLAVTGPDETLDATIDFFRRAIAKGRRLDAIGIGSFGPVELRPGHPQYGSITTTPKSGWSGTPLVGPFVAAFGVPVGFDTDVNAAALAEGRWGAARGLKSFVYLTLGTGIGGGAVIDGQILHGLGHSEMGHLAVPRHPDDAFEGVCPFHGDCLEGMASGPAVAARHGRRRGEHRQCAACSAVALALRHPVRQRLLDGTRHHFDVVLVVVAVQREAYPSWSPPAWRRGGVPSSQRCAAGAPGSRPSTENANSPVRVASRVGLATETPARPPMRASAAAFSPRTRARAPAARSQGSLFHGGDAPRPAARPSTVVSSNFSIELLFGVKPP